MFAPRRWSAMLFCLALLTSACGSGSASVEVGSEGDDGGAAQTSAPADGAGEGTAPARSNGPEAMDSVGITGDGLSAFNADQADPALGTVAPGFTTSAYDGSDVAVGTDGRAKVIGFLVHWCPHCQAEVPVLVDYFANNDLPDNVDVVAVSTGFDEDRGNWPPSAWFDRENWPFPVAIDSAASEIAVAYGMTSFPYFVVVGADGTVLERVAGGQTPESFAALLATAAS